MPGPLAEVRGQTAIVGVGNTDYGALYRNLDPTRTLEELGIEVLRKALDDSGLRIEQIDGLITSGYPYYSSLAYRTGLRDVRLLAPYPMSGRMCAPALTHAAMAVQAGMADYVALVYATNMRSVKMSFGGDSMGGDMYDPLFGLTSPGAYFAFGQEQYIEQYGYRGRDELLGEVSLAIRHHASLNPEAVFQEPLTMEDYLESRLVARPMRLFDYCLVTDGAVCYIVTSAERAKDLRKPPVLIAGFTEHAVLREEFIDTELFYPVCQTMAREIFDGTGLTLKDVGNFQVYDNFTAVVPWALEGFGFCPRGEGLDWIQNGRIRLGGELPMNTSGGMLSEAYMQGWNHHVDAVRQIRGEAGSRQIENCNAALYTNLGPVVGATLLSHA